MNVLGRRSSGAMVVCALKMVQVHPPDLFQNLPDRNPGGFVYSAALPRACFFREEFCTTFFHKRIKGRREIF